jgi:hypothetical protein
MAPLVTVLRRGIYGKDTDTAPRSAGFDDPARSVGDDRTYRRVAAYTTTLFILRETTAARTGKTPVGCRNPADVIATAAAVCTFTAILTKASQ